MDTIFETERLIVRWPEPELDAADTFEIYRDPFVTRYLGATPWVAPSVESEVERLTARRDRSWERADGTGVFLAEEKSSGVVIGSFLFVELIDGDRKLTGDYEIGWHLRRDRWGMGYGTEGAKAIASYAFEARPDLDVLHAVAYPENTASTRIMEKIGMKTQGHTKKYYGVELVEYILHRDSV